MSRVLLSITVRQRREGGKKVGVEGRNEGGKRGKRKKRLSVAGWEGHTRVSILKPTKPA